MVSLADNGSVPSSRSCGRVESQKSERWGSSNEGSSELSAERFRS